MRVQEPIPVLMYHSVAPTIEDWAFRYLSIDPAVFEDQIATLAQAGYTTVFLADLYRYVSGKDRLPSKSIVLTFDDGYLDNWVFAYPILKKHGFRATVFVSMDFIDKRDLIRPTLEDVWRERATREGLGYAGFLSVPEMAKMLASGVIDIQAHCKTHTWYFAAKEIVDLHHPGDSYPWLAWNVRPERKSSYLEEDQSEYVPFGSPVYVHEKSLVARRYFPDPSTEERLVQWVGANGGKDAFARPDWRDCLLREAQRAAPAGGRHEDDREHLARVREEIAGSKRDLEVLLDKRLDFLCWPGGAYDQTAVDVAREAGFLAWTLASRSAGSKRNVPGEDPVWIRRLPVAPWWHWRGRKRCALDGEFLRLVIEAYKGTPRSRFALRSFKLARLVRSYLSPVR